MPISLYHHVSHLRELQNTGRNFLLLRTARPHRALRPGPDQHESGSTPHRALWQEPTGNRRTRSSKPSCKGPETGLGHCHSLGATALLGPTCPCLPLLAPERQLAPAGGGGGGARV